MKLTPCLRFISSSSLREVLPPTRSPITLTVPPNASEALTALLTAPTLNTWAIRELLDRAAQEVTSPNLAYNVSDQLTVRLTMPGARWRLARPHRVQPSTEDKLNRGIHPSRLMLLRKYMIDGGTADRGALWTMPNVSKSQSKSGVARQKLKRRVREAVREVLREKGLGWDGRPRMVDGQKSKKDLPKSVIWGSLIIEPEIRLLDMPWPELLAETRKLVDKLMLACQQHNRLMLSRSQSHSVQQPRPMQQIRHVKQPRAIQQPRPVQQSRSSPFTPAETGKPATSALSKLKELQMRLSPGSQQRRDLSTSARSRLPRASPLDALKALQSGESLSESTESAQDPSLPSASKPAEPASGSLPKFSPVLRTPLLSSRKALTQGPHDTLMGIPLISPQSFTATGLPKNMAFPSATTTGQTSSSALLIPNGPPGLTSNWGSHLLEPQTFTRTFSLPHWVPGIEASALPNMPLIFTDPSTEMTMLSKEEVDAKDPSTRPDRIRLMFIRIRYLHLDYNRQATRLPNFHEWWTERVKAILDNTVTPEEMQEVFRRAARLIITYQATIWRAGVFDVEGQPLEDLPWCFRNNLVKEALMGKSLRLHQQAKLLHQVAFLRLVCHTPRVLGSNPEAQQSSGLDMYDESEIEEQKSDLDRLQWAMPPFGATDGQNYPSERATYQQRYGLTFNTRVDSSTRKPPAKIDPLSAATYQQPHLPAMTTAVDSGARQAPTDKDSLPAMAPTAQNELSDPKHALAEISFDIRALQLLLQSFTIQFKQSRAMLKQTMMKLVTDEDEPNEEVSKALQQLVAALPERTLQDIEAIQQRLAMDKSLYNLNPALPTEQETASQVEFRKYLDKTADSDRTGFSQWGADQWGKDPWEVESTEPTDSARNSVPRSQEFTWEGNPLRTGSSATADASSAQKPEPDIWASLKQGWTEADEDPEDAERRAVDDMPKNESDEPWPISEDIEAHNLSQLIGRIADGRDEKG